MTKKEFTRHLESLFERHLEANSPETHLAVEAQLYTRASRFLDIALVPQHIDYARSKNYTFSITLDLDKYEKFKHLRRAHKQYLKEFGDSND